MDVKGMMKPDAVLKRGDYVGLITLGEAERLYTTTGDCIIFPETGGYTLNIPKNVLKEFGGMLVLIHETAKVCGHFHYFIQIAATGQILNVQFCPAAFEACDAAETAEIPPPDPESMWYFLGVTDSISLRDKI